MTQSIVPWKVIHLAHFGSIYYGDVLRVELLSQLCISQYIFSIYTVIIAPETHTIRVNDDRQHTVLSDPH